MAGKKFAFESENTSIAFILNSGLGDSIIAKKVFDTLIELAPDCLIDIFCLGKQHFVFAKAFYGQSKNLNNVLEQDVFYKKHVQKYDLALLVAGYGFIRLDNVNVQRLQTMSPNLFESVVKIDDYNKRNVYRLSSFVLSITLRDTIAAEILGKNCYYFLSCGGALPIRDDKVNVPLLPEFKPKFDELKLDKYITIYTDIDEREKTRPKVKTWPIRCFAEYIARMKKRFPTLEIVQCGGSNDVKVENADRHYLGVDLELTKYILANSLLHVGGEGGLIHLTTALGTKCLVLFGPSSADYYGYDRNINLVSDICRPCMYTFGDGGINICMRGNLEPPCMLSHTPQTVCEVTCTYLKNKA